MKTLLKAFIAVALFFALFSAVVVLLTVDNKPSVTLMTAASVDDAKASHKIAKTLWDNLIKYKAPFVLSVTEQEINGQFVLLNRAIPRIKGQAQLTQNLTINLTLELPNNPIGKFINIHCDVLPSNNGLALGNLSVGSIALPESLTLWAIKTLLDSASGQQLGSVALNAIDAVSIQQTQLDISIAPIPDLKARLDKTRERFKSTRDLFPQFGDPAVVRIYYQHLIRYDQLTTGASKKSFTGPIQTVFSMASQRHKNPVEENKAAILALAMFYGSERVGSFIGSVRTPEMTNYVKRNPNLTLKNRNDLTKHFIISAALKIISETDITNAIGEFKELLDARRGGSGFSFIDLAADRAGVKFAEALIHPKKARIMQQLLASSADEALIFPSVYGLPEDISQAAFQQKYGNVESQRYIQLVKRIDGCIAELPAYQLNTYSVSREINACKF
ncbi:MAG: hypothetical protein MI976_15545 [Pseudomonadales bacterium]|nr:hypothetical protein [Pseudomonadales bacterium]